MDMLRPKLPYLLNDTGKTGGRISPPHGQKDPIIPTLKGNMEVGAKCLCPGKNPNKRLIEGERFYRPKPNAHDSRDTGYFLDQAGESPLSVWPEKPQVDTRQHHFAASRLGNPADFRKDGGGIPTDGCPSYERDDTVGAKVVATILDLYKSPGVKDGFRQFQRIPSTGRRGGQTQENGLSRSFSRFEESFNRFRDRGFQSVPDYRVHTETSRFRLPDFLGPATRGKYQPFRVFAPETPYLLPALPVGFGCNGTGEENRKIPIIV